MKLKTLQLSSFALTLALSLGAVACNIQYVREVKRTPSGGELALIHQSPDAQAQAMQTMQMRCTQGYDVLEEGETVVGQTTNTSGQEQTSRGTTFFGAPATRTSGNSTSTTTDQREWRIKYQCKTGSAVQPAAPVPSGTGAKSPSASAAQGAQSQAGAIHEIRIINY
jgi:hypothetical protein